MKYILFIHMLGHFMTLQAHYFHQMTHIKVIAIKKSHTERNTHFVWNYDNMSYMLCLTATNL